jgi:hypothetical protein
VNLPRARKLDGAAGAAIPSRPLPLRRQRSAEDISHAPAWQSGHEYGGEPVLRLGGAERKGSGPGDRSYIWDGARGCFNPASLREAMLVRGFMVDDLATAADVARGTLYNALNGRPTRLQTARRILEVLASVEPTLRLGSLSEPW